MRQVVIHSNGYEVAFFIGTILKIHFEVYFRKNDWLITLPETAKIDVRMSASVGDCSLLRNLDEGLRCTKPIIYENYCEAERRPKFLVIRRRLTWVENGVFQ